MTFEEWWNKQVEKGDGSWTSLERLAAKDAWDAARKNQWISVTDRVPHTDDEVLCLTETQYFVGRYYPDCNEWDTIGVTHWQEIIPPGSEE